MDEIRQQQKDLIKSKEAIHANSDWTVHGSKREGKKMVNRTVKLGLNAFNVQCDNAILKVNYKNINTMRLRIEKIRDNIDKLLEPMNCKINIYFYELKIQELELNYEYEERNNKKKKSND